ncbi:MAG: S49 family peptidase [Verrucomicrobia bacterium]|nr:S49 family peptidase [Verrucomicrobiota bacterium]
MAAASRSFLDRGAALPQPGQSSPLLSVEDGIGVVAIDGPIMRKPDLFARVLFSATDSNMIGDALREAGARDDIKAVFLDIDSPGGTVAGTPELAATVTSINERKPVYAFSSGLMASAAYWVASQARAIYATPSAQVGSIGVVQAVIDDTAALDAEGIKVTQRSCLPSEPIDTVPRSNGCDFPWHNWQLGHHQRRDGNPHHRHLLRLLEPGEDRAGQERRNRGCRVSRQAVMAASRRQVSTLKARMIIAAKERKDRKDKELREFAGKELTSTVSA